MNFYLFIVFALFGQVRCYDQLVSYSGQSSCSTDEPWVTLEGESGSWHREAGASETRFENPSSAITNVTFLDRHPRGDYRFSLQDGYDVLRTEDVKVEGFNKLPLTKLSTMVGILLTHEYRYLGLSHRFFSSDFYFPNVGKFFRGYMDKTANAVDKIVKYIMAKHATTLWLEGSNPTNYTCYLLEFGLYHEIPVGGTNTPENIKQAFEKAMKMEKKIVRTLTSIVHLAENIDDHEMIEFLSVDLIPGYTQSLKSLADHKHTIERLTKHRQQAALGEFIFDREFF